jgi:hypothetical protein
MKRVLWEVRFDKTHWGVFQGKRCWFGCSRKTEAVHWAAKNLRLELKYGVLTELFIKNKNGQIGKGSSGRRTYGKDPRGTRG